MKAYAKDLREHVRSRGGSGPPTCRKCAAVWCLLSQHQALPETTTSNGRALSQSHCGTSLQEICGPGSGSGRPTASVPRSHAASPLPVVGKHAWHVGRSHHQESCHAPRRVDAEKKPRGETSRNEEERAAWRAAVSPLPAQHLVVVEECGSNIALTPSDARAPKGPRATGRVPRHRGTKTTLLASLSRAGMGAAMILQGSANGAACELYVEQLLAPSLHVGHMVVRDNLRAQKGERIRQAMRPTAPRSKRPSPSSSASCDEWEPEHAKRLRKLFVRLCSW
jgi:hypothetical protein